MIRGGSGWLLLAALLAVSGSLASDRTTQQPNVGANASTSAQRSAQLYHEHCMGCHGPGAAGNATQAIPALAGQHEMYLLKELVGFTALLRDAPDMHRFMARKDFASPFLWRSMAAYLSKLPVNSGPETGDGRLVESGARIYKRACIKCHGRTGEGNTVDATPALRGQHYSFLILQLRAFAAGHRTDMELPVLDYMANLSLDELKGVADYVSRMPVDNSGQQEKHSTRD